MQDDDFELKKQVLRLDPYEAKIVQKFLNDNKEEEKVKKKKRIRSCPLKFRWILKNINHL